MERAEKIGLGVATAGHVLLFGLLSVGFLATPNPLKLNSPPMDVSLVDEVDLKSMAPQVSTQPPPPSVAPDQGPTEDAAPAPVPEPAPEPEPEPQPTPKPAPAPPPPKPAPQKPVAKPAPKPAPAPPKKEAPKAKPKPVQPAEKPKAAPQKPNAATPASNPAKSAQKADSKAKADSRATSQSKAKADKPARASGEGKADKPKGSLLGRDFLKGIDTEADAPRKAAPPAAASMGPAQKAALDAEIRRQLKPHWRPPSGADADQLVTLLEVKLDKNGNVVGAPEVIEQRGVTPSNKPQAQLHAERAIQAVKLASPFRNLPPEFYEQWKWLRPLRFDARLNR